MEESKAPPEKIKVVDRRRFTDDGEPRQDVPPPPEAAANDAVSVPEKPTSKGSTGEPSVFGAGGQRVDSGVRSEGPAQEIDSGAASPAPFLELVAVLGHQAELLLLGAENLPAQPAEARRMIDYLGALEEKTTGNLTSEESNALRNVIFQLRTLYVQSTR